MIRYTTEIVHEVANGEVEHVVKGGWLIENETFDGKRRITLNEDGTFTEK